MSKRTDGSVTAVFDDLLAAENAPPAKPSLEARTPRARGELHALAPTSLMVDTQPNEFVPQDIPDLGEPPPSRDAEALLREKSSRTMRFTSEANPASAFTAPPRVAAPEASGPVSVVPPPGYRLSTLLLAIAVTAVASVGATAFVGWEAMQLCRAGKLGDRACAAFR